MSKPNKNKNRMEIDGEIKNVEPTLRKSSNNRFSFYTVYSVLLFQMNLNMALSISVHILELTYKDRAGYTTLKIPSALESRTRPWI